MADRPAAVRLSVRVTPRARQNRIDGFRDGVLRIRVTAPAHEGRANEAVMKLLSKAAGMPKSRIGLVSGQRGRDKLIEIPGMDEAELRRRLTGGEPPRRAR